MGFDPVSLVFAFVLMVASYAISASMVRKPQNAKPAAMNEFEFPQAAEGTPQAIIFGDCWTDDWFVLWYGNFRVEPITKKAGKK